MGNAAPTGDSGFRVLRVHPGTPAEAADLEPFFDFITQIEEESLCSRDTSVQSVLKRIDAAEGRPIRLTVYNARHRMSREVYIQPARASSSLVLLGVSLQFASFDEALTSPLRVLRVRAGSPAEKAGLKEGADYILGDDKGAYRGVSDLIAGAEEHLGSSLSLFVFDKEKESVRGVVLQPCDDWGGEGCLGCDVGSGFLHRVPFSKTVGELDAAAAAAAAGAALADAIGAPGFSDTPGHEPPPQQELQQDSRPQAPTEAKPLDRGAPAAAAAAESGMLLQETADPSATVLGSCLLLPTTNSPLRDPSFPCALLGGPVGSIDTTGNLTSDGFGASGGTGSDGASEQHQHHHQQQEAAIEQQLQQRANEFSDNAKSAYLTYDLPYVAAMISSSAAAIEGPSLPGQLRLQAV